MLDEFAERLARHVDPGEELEAGRAPGVDAAIEDRHVAIAGMGQPPRRLARGRAVAPVHDHDRCRSPRRQRIDAQLQPRQRQAHRAEEMAFGEFALLAHVEQRQLAAGAQRRLQRGRVDQRRADRRARREHRIRAAAVMREGDAPGQVLEAQPVHVQMQARRLLLHRDRVEIVGQEGAGPAAPHHQLAGPAQLAAARRGAVVDAREEHVALRAMDPGDHGPGGVVVRRLRLAGTAGRRVEREAAIGVLRQAVDLARPAGRNREMLQREQLRAPAERDQFGRDHLQRVARRAVAPLDRAHPRHGLGDGVGAPLGNRHRMPSCRGRRMSARLRRHATPPRMARLLARRRRTK